MSARPRVLAAAAAAATLAATLAAVGPGAPPAGAAPAVSSFGQDNEGWQVVGDHATPAVWNAGGYVQVVDQVVGGVMYWDAPAKFKGDHSDAYGGSLRYQLRQNLLDSQFSADDIVLTGGGQTIRRAGLPHPQTTFTPYDVPLVAGDWLVGSTITPATEAQIRSVLAGITTLRIRAEYRTGADTDALDEVYLTGPAPTVSVAVNPVRVREGTGADTTVTATVTLSGAWFQDLKVTVLTADITALAGSDYVAVKRRLVFAPGETTKTVTVTVLGDGVDEPNEAFKVRLNGTTAPGGYGTRTARVTIADDD